MIDSSSSPCRPRTLAQEGNIRVDLCGCGQVHVTLGPFTMRLGRAQYLAFCTTLQSAAHGLPAGDPPAVH